VQDVIGSSDSFAEQFVISSVTQFIERWQVGWAVSVADIFARKCM